MAKRKTKDAVTILHKRFIKGDPAKLKALEVEREKIKIAEQLYTLRKQYDLTQAELAKKINTTQSTISRLEDTDYECPNLETLRKLASALNCRVEVRFVEELSLEEKCDCLYSEKIKDTIKRIHQGSPSFTMA